MKLLQIPKAEKRNKPLTVRLKASTYQKLQKLAHKNSVTQTAIIEFLIEDAYEKPSKRRV